jgi:hypothetical protein
MTTSPWPDEPPPCPRTLDDVLAYVFTRLRAGVTDRASPYRLPVLASQGADGGPDMRTVVLRGFTAHERTALIHTDRRTPKCAELRANPRAALLVHDAASNVQVRLWGTATLHEDDEIAEAAWAATGPGQMVNYATQPAPGTFVPSPPALPEATPAQARANFAVVRIGFHALEFLWLSRRGHWRARFEWAGGQLTANWQMP